MSNYGMAAMPGLYDLSDADLVTQEMVLPQDTEPRLGGNEYGYFSLMRNSATAPNEDIEERYVGVSGALKLMTNPPEELDSAYTFTAWLRKDPTTVSTLHNAALGRFVFALRSATATNELIFGFLTNGNMYMESFRCDLSTIGTEAGAALDDGGWHFFAWQLSSFRSTGVSPAARGRFFVDDAFVGTGQDRGSGFATSPGEACFSFGNDFDTSNINTACDPSLTNIYRNYDYRQAWLGDISSPALWRRWLPAKDILRLGGLSTDPVLTALPAIRATMSHRIFIDYTKGNVTANSVGLLNVFDQAVTYANRDDTPSFETCTPGADAGSGHLLAWTGLLPDRTSTASGITPPGFTVGVFVRHDPLWPASDGVEAPFVWFGPESPPLPVGERCGVANWMECGAESGCAVDVGLDAAHCGGCDVECAVGEYCGWGVGFTGGDRCGNYLDVPTDSLGDRVFSLSWESAPTLAAGGEVGPAQTLLVRAYGSELLECSADFARFGLFSGEWHLLTVEADPEGTLGGSFLRVYVDTVLVCAFRLEGSLLMNRYASSFGTVSVHSGNETSWPAAQFSHLFIDEVPLTGSQIAEFASIVPENVQPAVRGMSYLDMVQQTGDAVYGWTFTEPIRSTNNFPNVLEGPLGSPMVPLELGAWSMKKDQAGRVRPTGHGAFSTLIETAGPNYKAAYIAYGLADVPDDAVTISGWYRQEKPSGYTGVHCYFSFGGLADGSFIDNMILMCNTVAYVCNSALDTSFNLHMNDTAPLRAGGSFGDGNWHLLTLSFNFTTSELSRYVDGFLEASDIIPCSADFEQTGSTFLLLGNDVDSNVAPHGIQSTQQFYGEVDDVFVFSRLLDQDEIRQLYLVGSAQHRRSSGHQGGQPVRHAIFNPQPPLLHFSLDVTVLSRSQQGTNIGGTAGSAGNVQLVDNPSMFGWRRTVSIPGPELLRDREMGTTLATESSTDDTQFWAYSTLGELLGGEETFTMSIYIQLPEVLGGITTGDRYVFGALTENARAAVTLSVDGNDVSFLDVESGAKYPSPINLADALGDFEWHLLVLTINAANGTSTLFFDGDLLGSVTPGAYLPVPLPSSKLGMSVLRQPTTFASAGGFDDFIDDDLGPLAVSHLAVYREPLSRAQMRAMTAAASPFTRAPGTVETFRAGPAASRGVAHVSVKADELTDDAIADLAGIAARSATVVEGSEVVTQVPLVPLHPLYGDSLKYELEASVINHGSVDSVAVSSISVDCNFAHETDRIVTCAGPFACPPTSAPTMAPTQLPTPAPTVFIASTAATTTASPSTLDDGQTPGVAGAADTTGESKGMDGATIGAIVGIIVAFLLGIVLIALVMRRREAKRSAEAMAGGAGGGRTGKVAPITSADMYEPPPRSGGAGQEMKTLSSLAGASDSASATLAEAGMVEAGADGEEYKAPPSHPTSSLQSPPSTKGAPNSTSSTSPGSSKGQTPGYDDPRGTATSSTLAGTMRTTEFAGHAALDADEVELSTLLGEGAFGEVWKGEWREQDVAVKKIKGTDEGAIKAMWSEIEQLKRLRPHENCVLYFGVVQEPEMMVLLEYCAGGSLDALIYTNPTLTREQANRYALGIARGMLHLHREGIIHRDLATRNVLLKNDIPKVTDFGLSRTGTDDDETAEAQRTQTTTGPLRWMSPEAMTEQIVSKAGDVWMFGATLIEMYTMAIPFSGKKNMAAARIVMDGGHADIPDDAPGPVKDAMAACFVADYEQRPTMKQVYSILKKMK